MLDFVGSERSDGPVVVERHFAASPARVFAAWTDPSIVTRWFGSAPNSLHSATIDLRPGGAWRFLVSQDDEKTVGVEGKYLEIDPNRRLVFSWCHFTAHSNGRSEATLHARIELTLEADGDGTAVRLVHSLIDSADSREGIDVRWAATLDILAGLLSDGE